MQKKRKKNHLKVKKYKLYNISKKIISLFLVLDSKYTKNQKLKVK